MNRTDLERLRDAREFSRHAQNNATGLSAEVLAEAKQPQHAALYNLAVIGETLHRVSAEVKSSAPDIKWKEFADLRNFVIHAYWQLDFEIIADVVETELDILVQELNRLIAFVERSES
jgi:uncharacterized protein with HEPN domain